MVLTGMRKPTLGRLNQDISGFAKFRSMMMVD